MHFHVQLVLLTRPLPQPIVLHQSNAITDKELNDGKVVVFSLQLIFFFFHKMPTVK